MSPKILLKFTSIFCGAFIAFLFCLISAQQAHAAVGDITAVRIVDEGWYAEIDIDGFVASGTPNYGFAEDSNSTTTDNDPINAKIVFTVTSQGYNTSGVLGTVTRTVYGTKFIRKPYPESTMTVRTAMDEVASGGTLTIKVALSEYIYADDENGGAGTSGTDPTVSIAANFYRDTGTGGTNGYTNPVTNMTVTNNSTAVYPKVIGRWAWPGYERFTADFLVEAVAFHRFVKNAKPVAAVAFSAADQSGNRSHATTTAMSISTRTGDANPVIVYAATMDIDALDQAEVIDVNFIAYPWIGDERSVLNSAIGADGYAQPNERLGPLHAMNDKSGTYGVGYAYVAPGGAGGTVQSSQVAAEGGVAYPTIAAAMAALKTYHNSSGSPTRNSAGGGVILLAEGNYPFPGGTPADMGTMDTWMIIRPATGAAKANTKISSGGTTDANTAKLKIEGITVSPSASSGGISGSASTDALWLHDNIINATTTGTLFAWKAIYGTQNAITSMPSGFSNFGASIKAPAALVRGNNSTSIINSHFYTILGNKNVSGANFLETRDPEVTTAGMASSTNVIYAYNTIYNSESVLTWAHNSTTTGLAIIQNLFERVAGNPEGMLDISAGFDNGSSTSNFLVWHNTITGGRVQYAYNSAGSEKVLKSQYSNRFNIFLDQGAKTDTFTGVTDGNANRTGNWSIVYNVGSVGERSMKNSFGGDFNGLFSGRKVGTGADYYLPGYISDLSKETGANTGNGNYQLRADSIVIDTGTTTSDFYNTIPYDLLGNPRYGPPDSGAFEYQPPYTMGTHNVATSSVVRMYGNEKWRPVSATTTSGTADLSITIPGSDTTEWLDITISTWENTGTRRKVWTETSSTTALTNTEHVVGDLAAATSYTVKVDTVLGQNITGGSCTGGVCTSNGSGEITFTYTGTYSSHTFDVEEGDDTTAPVISDIATSTSDTTATITWTTDEAASSTVNYGANSSYGTASSSATYVTEHSITLTGLTAATTYHYQVSSGDAAFNYATSSDATFTTAAAPDATPPTVSITAPANAARVTGAAVTISADASDNVGVAGVQFKRATNTNIGVEDTTSAYSVSWDTTGLSDGSQTLIAVARDAAGNYATSSSITVTVDNTAPTITNVSSDKTNGTYGVGEVIDIDVTFSEAVTSTGNVTVTLETGTTDRTCTFSVSAATSGTCDYTVQAGDTTSDLTVASISGTIADATGIAMSNFSPATNLAANKALVIDTTAPVRSNGSPTGTQAFGTASVVLSLDTNETATCKYSTSAATAYGSMTLFSTTTATTHQSTIGSLSNGTSYTYYVKCQDAVANTNADDYSISFSVAADASSPTVSITAPSNGATVTGASVSITANASDNDAVAGVQFKLDTNTNIGAEDTSSAYGVTWDSTAVADGNHTLIAVARDTSNNYATSSSITVTVDNTAPTITNVSSDKSNATYGVGEVIDIDVTFSEAVTSSGNITVTLETGDTDRTCTFSASSATSGTCNYTVQSGDTSSDLTVASISGTVADGAGIAMTNFAPATNLAANKALVIDTTAPVRSSGSPTGELAVDTTSTAISLSTNEAATCKFGTVSSTAYGSIVSTFGTTGGTTHSDTVGSLTNDTSYTYYVRCQDAVGNTNSNDYNISFSVAAEDDEEPEPEPEEEEEEAPRRRGGGGGSRVRDPGTVPVAPTVTAPTTPAGTSLNVSFAPTVRLSLGTTNTDVRNLQILLNSRGYTVAVSGPGSRGLETTYFGPATLAALQKFQCQVAKICSGSLYGVLNSDIATLLLATPATLPLPTTVLTPIVPITSVTPTIPAPTSVVLPTGLSRFTRQLGVGSTGADVRQLQQFLNAQGFAVAATGAGSKGNESTTFGPATKAALIKFQEFYRSEILIPAGLTTGNGFFGPMSLKKVNSLLGY